MSLRQFLEELRALQQQPDSPVPPPFEGLTDEQVAAVDEQMEAA